MSKRRPAGSVAESLVAGWPARAGVRKLPLAATCGAPTQPEFLESLLPFSGHPRYRGASAEMKDRILACGWIAYNEKSICIEADIVAAACREVIAGTLPGLTDDLNRRLHGQILVDEAYHILILVDACRLTRQRRSLPRLEIPEFELLRRVRRAREDVAEPWKRRLSLVVSAVVSEVSISDYLRQLAAAPDLEPLNRATTDAHRRDEPAYAVLFREVARALYGGLSSEGRRFVERFLVEPLTWFTDPELEVWRAMLGQLGFEGADDMLDDRKAAPDAGRGRRDYSGVLEIARDLELPSVVDRIGERHARAAPEV
jgi:hypothetical protein